MWLQEKLANMLFGRDFASDTFWSEFLFKYFLVERSLSKKRWRTSHQGICLAAMFFLIFFRRLYLQTIVGKEFSSKKGVVENVVSGKWANRIFCRADIFWSRFLFKSFLGRAVALCCVLALVHRAALLGFVLPYLVCCCLVTCCGAPPPPSFFPSSFPSFFPPFLGHYLPYTCLRYTDAIDDVFAQVLSPRRHWRWHGFHSGAALSTLLTPGIKLRPKSSTRYSLVFSLKCPPSMLLPLARVVVLVPDSDWVAFVVPLEDVVT